MYTRNAAKMAALLTAATSAAAPACGASGGRAHRPQQARPSRRLRGRELEQSGNFLGLELLQDITLEIAHASEKPIFGLGQSSASG